MQLFRVLLSLAVLAYVAPAQSSIPEYTYTVVHTYPHDGTAFTEALFYLNGFLHGGARRPDKSYRNAIFPNPIWGEGIVAWKNRLLELTYADNSDSSMTSRHSS